MTHKIYIPLIICFIGSMGSAQITNIDSVATSKVQHFNFDQMKSDTIGVGITRKWFHGEKGQMTIFNLEKAAHIPWHKHPNEQITYIISGKVKIKTIMDGKEEFVIVSGGEVIVFPENVPHEFWAMEPTVDLDVHVPVRQDWLSNDLPEYLKDTNKKQ
ncbi:cupin domain-containing protein [Arenibacter aquaticus]|uniref:Cupin domain-containing protein n=1 Tax=Arenibacter aquaticus TaxID=2489054 RepID=A0A430JYW3_9FLAO|nr:cupin domain-containing protein [Arenibacter aquaticus]RTE52010.1 cupin domain-containing protein [Arenibacter aquaticus]